MILPIRLYGDPVLRTKARTVTDFSSIPKLAEDMLETMYEAKGVGLAAPQVGQGVRVFVVAEYSDEEHEGEDTELKSRVLNEYVMVNPTLEVLDATLVEGVEGCLSIPQIYIDGVSRVRALRVNFQNERGEAKSLEFEDFNARVIQHEFDHLESRLFIDLLPPEVMLEHREALVGMQRDAKAFLKELRASEKAAKPGLKPVLKPALKSRGKK
jgi:peptide deformylase